MTTVQCTRIFVGIDLHKDSAVVAVLRGWEQEFADERTLPHDLVKIRRYLQRLGREGEVIACYEAGSCGYVLQRTLAKAGIECVVIAPSLVSRKAGDRRKTDKIDARLLARQLRNGDLTIVSVPDEKRERERELGRCRETLRREIHRSRQYILKLLTRRGLLTKEKNWTLGFWAWLRTLELPDHDKTVLSSYIALLDTKLQMLGELDVQLGKLAETPEYIGPVSRLRCLHGIDTLSAMVLVTEIGDARRFGSARALMAYLGLAVAERSSGNTSRRYGITKTGNGRCRRILVEAAWQHRHRPRASKALQKRRAGQPPEVIAHAQRAHRRLYKRFHAMADRKAKNAAATAVARELAGFVWALLRAEPELLADPKKR